MCSDKIPCRVVHSFHFPFNKKTTKEKELTNELTSQPTNQRRCRIVKKIVEQNRNIAATDHWSGPARPGSINVSDGGMSSCCCSIGFVGTEWIDSLSRI